MLFLNIEKTFNYVSFFQEDLMSFSNSVCSIFWSDPVITDIDLPSSTKGKLGGPSPRRLPLHITSSVLQAV